MAYMMDRISQFLLSFLLLGCGKLVMEPGPDAAAAPPDAVTVVDAAPPDAGPQPDAGPPSCGGDVFVLADVFGRGPIGEAASFELGMLRGESCLEEVCEPEPLYVGDQGLGVVGTDIGGDSFTGYGRVTLTLAQPRQLEYFVYRGQDFAGGDDRVHHRVTAFLGEQVVLDRTPEGLEYRMPTMPPADRVIWSAVGDPGEFADSVTLYQITACPTPAEISVQTTRSWPRNHEALAVP
jgi:hypothetical protein